MPFLFILLGYFIWFAEEIISAEETIGQENGHESGGDVRHPGGRQAVRVLWTLLSAAHSRKKLPSKGDILQPAQPTGHRKLRICYGGLTCFTLCYVLCSW